MHACRYEAKERRVRKVAGTSVVNCGLKDRFTPVQDEAMAGDGGGVGGPGCRVGAGAGVALGASRYVRVCRMYEAYALAERRAAKWSAKDDSNAGKEKE